MSLARKISDWWNNRTTVDSEEEFLALVKQTGAKKIFVSVVRDKTSGFDRLSMALDRGSYGYFIELIAPANGNTIIYSKMVAELVRIPLLDGAEHVLASAAGSLSSGTIGTKSLPSAPRPCIQMTAAVGASPVVISTVSSNDMVLSLLYLIEKSSVAYFWRIADFGLKALQTLSLVSI